MNKQPHLLLEKQMQYTLALLICSLQIEFLRVLLVGLVYTSRGHFLSPRAQGSAFQAILMCYFPLFTSYNTTATVLETLRVEK